MLIFVNMQGTADSSKKKRKEKIKFLEVWFANVYFRVINFNMQFEACEPAFTDKNR